MWEIPILYEGDLVRLKDTSITSKIKEIDDVHGSALLENGERYLLHALEKVK